MGKRALRPGDISRFVSPGEYHGFQKPGHKADRFARTLAWFQHYLVKA